MDISLILMIGHSLSAFGLLALCFVQYKWKKEGRELKGLERENKLKKHEEIGKKSILELMKNVDEFIPQPDRPKDKDFLMPVEDVFSISGRGTVCLLYTSPSPRDS